MLGSVQEFYAYEGAHPFPNSFAQFPDFGDHRKALLASVPWLERMNANILLVGDDLSLLTTRAMLLAQWHTEIATSSESLRILSLKPFDVVIIGQLVRPETAMQLIERSKSLNPMPSLLAIRFPGDELNGIASYSTSAATSPGWLRDCVSHLLADRLRQD